MTASSWASSAGLCCVRVYASTAVAAPRSRRSPNHRDALAGSASSRPRYVAAASASADALPPPPPAFGIWMFSLSGVIRRSVATLHLS